VTSQAWVAEEPIGPFLESLGLMVHHDALIKAGFDEMRYIMRMKPVDFLNLVSEWHTRRRSAVTYRAPFFCLDSFNPLPGWSSHDVSGLNTRCRRRT
jgi:hypothetical protein